MEETYPVKEFYNAQGKYTSVDGLGTIDEITGRLFAEIDATLTKS